MHPTFNLVLLLLCINLILYIFSFLCFLFYVFHSNTFSCNRDIALFKYGGEGCRIFFEKN